MLSLVLCCLMTVCSCLMGGRFFYVHVLIFSVHLIVCGLMLVVVALFLLFFFLLLFFVFVVVVVVGVLLLLSSSLLFYSRLPLKVSS